MLSEETRDFYKRWMKKAKAYTSKSEPSLTNYFDKFFTLYVLYNRLYSEVASILDQRDPSFLDRRDYFPDREAATEYVLQYMGATSFIQAIESDEKCNEAIAKIIKLLEEDLFSIQLSRVRGYPQREIDLDLLSKLKDGNRATKSEAILNLIYAIRCNMFHGHKQFHSAQRVLLEPINTLLQKVIEVLYGNLSRREG